MAGESFKVHYRPLVQGDVQHIPAAIVSAGFHPEHIARAADDAFGQQKSHREFFIMAGRAHGHAHRPVLNADFQRLLDGQFVLRLPQ